MAFFEPPPALQLGNTQAGAAAAAAVLGGLLQPPAHAPQTQAQHHRHHHQRPPPPRMSAAAREELDARRVISRDEGWSKVDVFLHNTWAPLVNRHRRAVIALSLAAVVLCTALAGATLAPTQEAPEFFTEKHNLGAVSEYEAELFASPQWKAPEDTAKQCPGDTADETCSGHGRCLDSGTCLCDRGWGTTDRCDEEAVPTAGPSPAPTHAPMPVPTRVPVPVPTATPTSAAPTLAPTSSAPTVAPSATPTTAASYTPSPTFKEETFEPTAVPVPHPTPRPTAEQPTSAPTAVPAPEPTARPTLPHPSAVPTAAPTETPAAPTPAPTVSFAPTIVPVPSPTYPLEECASSECNDNGLCRSSNGVVACTCYAGYAGYFCDEQIVPPGNGANTATVSVYWGVKGLVLAPTRVGDFFKVAVGFDTSDANPCVLLGGTVPLPTLTHPPPAPMRLPDTASPTSSSPSTSPTSAPSET